MGVLEHRPVDDVAEPALECPSGLSRGFAFADFPGVVVTAPAAVLDLADGHCVEEDGVELSVAAGVEPLALVFAAGGI
jgi:hypothetical protein